MSENSKVSGTKTVSPSKLAPKLSTIGSSIRIPAGTIKISKSQRVLKADQVAEQTQIQIQRFDAPRFSRGQSNVQTVEDLKRNMGRLQDLHSRLRFMIKELEDLVGTRK